MKLCVNNYKCFRQGAEIDRILNVMNGPDISTKSFWRSRRSKGHDLSGSLYLSFFSLETKRDFSSRYFSTTALQMRRGGEQKKTHE